MNIKKYVDLAHLTPAGLALRKEVDAAWPEWLLTVETAPWLHQWSKWLNKNSQDTDLLARRIFFSGVWGYGWELWHCGVDAGVPGFGVAGKRNALAVAGVEDSAPAPPRRASGGSAALACLASLQGVGAINPQRTWVWDAEFLSRGEFVPCEFAAMDKWLESLLVATSM